MDVGQFTVQYSICRNDEDEMIINYRDDKFFNCLRRATALYNLGLVAILLANTRKPLKFYRFESA